MGEYSSVLASADGGGGGGRGEGKRRRRKRRGGLTALFVVVVLAIISLLTSYINTTATNGFSRQRYMMTTTTTTQQQNNASDTMTTTTTTTPEAPVSSASAAAERAVETIISTMMMKKNSSQFPLWARRQQNQQRNQSEADEEEEDAEEAKHNRNTTTNNNEATTSSLLSFNSSSSTSFFSACLLTMDDNHRLPEWISYHYLTLNLKYLVVAVDPHSKTSPLQIFDRWKDRIEIVIWSDHDFALTNLMINTTSDTAEQRINKHRTRQQNFYRACMKYLKRQKQQSITWTAFIDTDEFITINNDALQVVGGGVNSHNGNSVPQLISLSQPGSILRIVEALSNSSSSRSSTNNMHNNETSSSDLLAGALANGQLRVIQSSSNNASSTKNNNKTIAADIIPPFWYEHFQQSCCATIARALYSAVESSDEEINRDVPDFINPMHYDTLRYRYRAVKRNGGINSPGKSIIDLSRIKRNDYKRRGNAHRPLTTICPNAWIGYDQLPIGIHHYLGSWGSYSSRENDARKGPIRNYDDWNRRSMMQQGGPDDEIRPWISSFVNYVGGQKNAQFLLQQQHHGAGDEYPNPNLQYRNQTTIQ